MPEKKDNRIVNLILALSLIALIFILWTFDASYITIGIFVSLWVIVVLLWSLMSKRQEVKEYKEIIEKPEKIMLLDDKQAKNILNLHLEDEGLRMEEHEGLLEHNIQPEDPDKSPTYFFIRMFRETELPYWFLHFVNRKTGIINLKKFMAKPTGKTVVENLKNASESTREMFPIITQHPDGRTETSYKLPRIPKPVVKPDEERIRE